MFFKSWSCMFPRYTPGYSKSLQTAAFIAAASGDNAWEGSDSTHLTYNYPHRNPLFTSSN